jgi:VIT1/CCC1 family predicted Fe2+/Mn2+ transporter
VGAKPIQAAGASAIAFSVGAAMPTLAAFLAPRDAVVIVVPAAALALLVALGALGAWTGGAPNRETGAQGRLLGRAGHGGDGGDRRAGR